MNLREYSNYTCTQKLLIVQLANKYTGYSFGCNDYAYIDVKELYNAMVKNGATVIELCAMAEQFKECHVALYGE
jgi:hypothetical protein